MTLMSNRNYWIFFLFICSFGQLSFNTTSDNIHIDYYNLNNLPKFDFVFPLHIPANTTETVTLHATNTEIIESINLPDFIVFTDLGNGNASFEISPNNINTGTHSLTFIARNALLSTTLTIPLTVYPDNGIAAELPEFINELNIEMRADSVYHKWLHATYTNEIIAPKLPAFISLTDHGNGASELYIQPDGINIGDYDLEFFALGPYGIDTLNVNLTIDSGLVAPQDSLCHLSTVEIFSTSLSFSNLFDEQYLTADPTANLNPHPSNPWFPGWDWALFPTIGYIDFGSPQPITSIFLNDGIGAGPFNIYVGSSPTDMDTIAVATDTLFLFEIWHEHVINQTTQFLFFEMETPSASVTEALIYGMCDLEIDTIPPAPIMDLQVEHKTSKTVNISWNSTGDDHNIGKASGYDLRYSTSPITDSSFNQLPSFLIENSTDTMLEKSLMGLDCETDYFFAIKAIDDVNNISTLSNTPTTSTLACNPNISITISFDSIQNNTPTINLAKLRFNKDFAYSLSLDDGSAWEYNVTFPILNGGMTPNGEMNDGFFYTDGCGNDLAFRAGVAINGFWILDEPYGNNFMTWDEVRTLYQADWDILNHSFSHCSDRCNYISEVTENVNIVQDRLGFNLTHFAVPSGDNEGYRLPAFDNGMQALYDQYFPTPYKYGIQVDQLVDLDSFEMHRNTLENEVLPYGEDIDSVAILSENGDHFWFNEYAHRIGYPTDQFIYVNADDFKNYMEHIENNFGRFGADNIWFAPPQEVFEYIQVRDLIEIENVQMNGNQLTFDISTDQIPTTLRRNSISLLINEEGASNIFNIEATNANVKFNSEGLINLDW